MTEPGSAPSMLEKNRPEIDAPFPPSDRGWPKEPIPESEKKDGTYGELGNNGIDQRLYLCVLL